MESEKIIFMLKPTIIQDLPFERYEQNFTFIVDGKRYSSSRIVADLLSPIIRELHFQDESNQEFYIDTKKYQTRTSNEDNDNDFSFSNFLQLLKFTPTELDFKTRELYSLYFFELGNIESFLELEFYNTTELTIEKSISILHKIENKKKSSNNFVVKEEYKEKIINFISSHFEELNKEEIKELELETLEEIICSPALKINDEDSLLDFLICQYEEDRTTSFLFEYVQFCNVSEEHLKTFVDKILVEDINQKTFNHFCERIFCKDKMKEKENERYIKNNPYCVIQKGKGKELEGILNFLTKQTGGNIHDNGTIEITSNSIHSDYHPKNLVDYQSDNYYYPAGNDRNAFVCFDFKDKLIQLTSYSIKSHDADINCKHLRNWVIEVSNDGKTWQEIDRRENEDKLNGRKLIVNFEISPPMKEFYRFIRLLETGINWDSRNNRYDGFFSKIEFFGKLQQTKT